MQKLTLSTIAKRLTNPTPPFWKKVQKVCAIVAVIAGGIIGAPKAGVDMPEFLIKAAEMAIYFCGTIAAVAQATINTPSETPPDDAAN